MRFIFDASLYAGIVSSPPPPYVPHAHLFPFVSYSQIDGSYCVNFQFMNDIAFGTTGGMFNFSLTIKNAVGANAATYLPSIFLLSSTTKIIFSFL
jgi:hypothetical protein